MIVKNIYSFEYQYSLLNTKQNDKKLQLWQVCMHNDMWVKFFVIASHNYVIFTKKIIHIYSFLLNCYPYCNWGHNGPIHEVAVLSLNQTKTDQEKLKQAKKKWSYLIGG